MADKINILAYDDIFPTMLNLYERKMKELPPPPDGYHYTLSEPKFLFNDKETEWSVETSIVLEEDGK